MFLQKYKDFLNLYTVTCDNMHKISLMLLVK